MHNVPPSENVVSFFQRFYEKAMRRSLDDVGRDYWGREITIKRQTITEAAYGIIFSFEFIGFRLSDAEYVERLYETFMDRPSDSNGLNYWLNNLASGASREDVFYGFANPNEFNAICEYYDIYN